MKLNVFAAQKRLALFDELKSGLAPSEGSYNASALAEGRLKDEVQLGSTRFEPGAIHFEFIFPDSATSSTVVTVTLDPPERIVFLPVPEWVIESIWQGEISGSYEFESEAMARYSRFGGELEPENNAKWFGPQMAKRRE
jgi:hypothetical protein